MIIVPLLLALGALLRLGWITVRVWRSVPRSNADFSLHPQEPQAPSRTSRPSCPHQQTPSHD